MAPTREQLLSRATTTAAINAAKETCPSGHPYDPVNTYVHEGTRRYCRACNRQRQAEWRARNPRRTRST